MTLPVDHRRRHQEDMEALILSPHAARARSSRGRQRPEPECPVRTVYQRDRDRVLHCKAFRRLAHKTQVFLSPTGDHYRTRITHTLEVSQIARTISRGLRLNEDLTEAIALGHDLGHTPFGHSGEAALDELFPGGFRHYQQSLRVVDLIERDGQGLNLTAEVRDGILRHSKGKGPILGADPSTLPATFEGQVVRLADLIAYVSHDLDDALRGQVIQAGDVPPEVTAVLGHTTGERIAHMVTDVLEATDLDRAPLVLMSDATHEAMHRLRAFLYEHLYFDPKVHEPFVRAKAILGALWETYLADTDHFFEHVWPDCPEPLRADPRRAVCDFLASMTDRYALRLWEKMFVPRRWDLL
jgi:dGTPase